MIDFLTRNPLALFLKRLQTSLGRIASRSLDYLSRPGVALRVGMVILVAGFISLFFDTILSYRDQVKAFQRSSGGGKLEDLPSIIPIICEGIGVFLALVGLLVSFWVRKSASLARRNGFTVIVLSIAAMAGLAVWLPADIIETQAAMSGKALAGESPSIPAYFGQLFLISMIILSVPVMAMVYIRLGLMDQYLIKSFAAPFTLSMVAFMAIWAIGDLTETASDLAMLSLGDVLKYYIVQVPFIALFVMPVAVLMSGLSALSKMSKANELIGMIGSGRSVMRIIFPLILASAYVSFIGLAFKYEWAPTAKGYREAILGKIATAVYAKRAGLDVSKVSLEGEESNEIWSKRSGWMHVNDIEHRTWFVGRIPLNLSDAMADVVVLQFDGHDQPAKLWVASRAKWIWSSEPPTWILSDVRCYTYENPHVPTIEKKDQFEIKEWSETPWKVLSSSQDPEYLGIPGLSMYLKANGDQEDRDLAAFRTYWWNVFAEPASCFILMLIAAPLGIVYSRRGGAGGVTAAIIVFALMFVMRGTFIAMGHSNRMPPFLAAWMTNMIIGSVGLLLLWLKAHNREIPSLKTMIHTVLRLGNRRAAAG